VYLNNIIIFGPKPGKAGTVFVNSG